MAADISITKDANLEHNAECIERELGRDLQTITRGPFLESPENLSGPKSNL